MHNESGVSVQHAREEGVGSPKIDIGKVRMPLVMGPGGLIKALTMRFLTVGNRPLAGETGLLQDPEDAGGRDGHHIPVQHHEGQDRLPLLRKNPVTLGKTIIET